MSDPIQLLADIVHFQSPLPPPSVAPVAKKLCPWAEVPPAELHYQLIHRNGRFQQLRFERNRDFAIITGR
jgi:hypothetical protein